MKAIRNATGLALAATLCVDLALVRTATAQVAEPVPPGTTELNLTSSASVHSPPDRLTIALFAEKSAASPAKAQSALNAVISQASQRAQGVRAISTSIESYDVSREDDKSGNWSARQTIRLSSGDAGALLELAGQLQAMGLAIERMQWSLSDENREKLTREAETKALGDLRARGAMAADALGMKVASIRRVSLEQRSFLPGSAMMAMRASAAPQSTPQEQQITANATATILLTQK